MASHEHPTPRTADFLAQPLSALFWWGLPLIAGWSADALPVAQTAKTLVWAGALGWMASGCALNAVRCHRLHCAIAAPVLFVGAIGTLVCASGFAPLGPHTASYVINASLLLAVLSFAAEPIWGKYRPG